MYDQPNAGFDLDVAISVCRTRPCSIDVALTLAQQHAKHDVCLSIMVEDKQQYFEATQYIAKLPFATAEQNLCKYGAILMENCPEETTELLKKMCTNYVVAESSYTKDELNQNQVDRSDSKNFIHLFGNDQDRLIYFLEHLVRNINDVMSSIYDLLIELYLGRWKQNAKAPARIMDILLNQECDFNHAMVLCRMHEFWPGLMHIYEDQNM